MSKQKMRRSGFEHPAGLTSRPSLLGAGKGPLEVGETW